VLSFGPFEVDASTRELRKRGVRVRLSGQPFQILLILLARPGDLVTREQLRDDLWSEGTFVDFEGSLNAAVKKLRRALNESAENPRYIETVPKRGYRFIAPVIESPNIRLPVPKAELLEGRPDEETLAPSPPLPAPGRPARAWAVMLALLTMAVAGLLTYILHATTKLTDRDTIVLADFVNKTGDTVFDGTLHQGLTVQLEQSPFLRLVSEQRIRQTLHLMSQPPDARLTPELAREVCERTGSLAVLEGSIARLGSQYVLGLGAKNCRTGEVLANEQVQVARKEDVLNAVSQIARRFRSRVGESLASVTKYDTPLDDATTRSLEALKAYSAAWKVHFSRGATEALPLFKQAVEIDPEFAMAHAALGRIYADLDQSDLSAASVKRAWELRDRTSDRERFFIASNYAILVTGNLEEAKQTSEAWAQTYPRDTLPHTLLSGLVNKTPGRYEKAAAEAQKAIDLEPNFGIAYYNLAVNELYLNHLEKAQATLQRAADRGLKIEEFLMLAYDIAFLKADSAGMQQVAGQARAGTEPASWISNREAFAFAYSGRLRQANSMSQRAAAEARQTEQPERAALWDAAAAVENAFFGRVSEARSMAAAALALSHNRDVSYGAALALALSGDSRRAQTIAHELERRFPEDTSVQFSYLPVLRSRLALNQGDPQKAIDLLRAAAPFELGMPPSGVSALFGALYPIYVRGEAYLALHRSAEAAAEFQKIIDHRGIVVSDPIGALAHLQLGRALALSADKIKTRMAYEDFLALWKDADSDIPILRQAKTEYAKLQ
jgi:DNA-binding winged helix-turn-helix (wHTH) protein/Tfp pilus assembly protein PilF